ncbi:MAG: hypothetical protein QOE06_1784 [Thermoleophilaceae bacterium]|nr:hypothetical protein [Thermoleophilaceae bacterium]
MAAVGLAGPVTREQRLLLFARYVLPGAIVVGGLAAIFVGGSKSSFHGGMGIIGAGIAVGLLSLFYRVGASGERDRDAEDEARSYFDRHGHWPDEDAQLPGQP